MPVTTADGFSIVSAGYINAATLIPRAAQTRGEILPENSDSSTYWEPQSWVCFSYDRIHCSFPSNSPSICWELCVYHELEQEWQTWINLIEKLLILPLAFSTPLSLVACKGFRTLALIKQQFYYPQSKPEKKSVTDSKRRLQGSINSFTFLCLLIEVFLIFIISHRMLKRKMLWVQEKNNKPKMNYCITILYHQFAYFCDF